MAYLVRTLVTQAFQQSNITARTLETVSGDDLDAGVQWLNEILSEQNLETRLLPYYKEYELTGIPGQEKYFIPGLVEVVSFNFYLDSGKIVRYATVEANREDYFGSTRVNGIQALPFKWHTEKAFETPDSGASYVEGQNLYVYFTPNAAYPFSIWGKFALSKVTAETDLSKVYAGYFTKYLRYCLQEEICSAYSLPMSEDAQKTLYRLRKQIKNKNPFDMKTHHVNRYDELSVIGWGQVNIGKGWTPGGPLNG